MQRTERSGQFPSFSIPCPYRMAPFSPAHGQKLSRLPRAGSYSRATFTLTLCSQKTSLFSGVIFSPRRRTVPRKGAGGWSLNWGALMATPGQKWWERRQKGESVQGMERKALTDCSYEIMEEMLFAREMWNPRLRGSRCKQTHLSLYSSCFSTIHWRTN